MRRYLLNAAAVILLAGCGDIITTCEEDGTMISNAPVAVELVSTNIVDPAEVFDNTIKQNFAGGKELRYGNDVYRNDTDATIFVTDYSASDTYAVGDFRYKDSVIKRVTSIADTEVPKQPQSYTSGYDTSFDSSTWSKRYFRIGDYSEYDGNTFSIENVVGSDTYVYQLEKQVFSSGGGIVVSYRFIVWKNGGQMGNYAVTTLTSELTNETIETDAYVFSSYEFYGRTIIINTSGIFIRTNVAAAPEYDTVTEPQWDAVVSPASLGFVYRRLALEVSPFDDKQYTSVINYGDQSWTIKSLRKFNGVAIGRLRGDSMDIVFKDASGTTVSSVLGRTINDTIDANLDPEPTTDIIYAGEFIEANGTIEITVYGDETEVGQIFPTASIDIGMTGLEFQHEVINFDRYSVSEISGYVDLIVGNRVIDYTGTFTIPITDYDKTVLMTKKLTNALIAIDGSDTTANEATDSCSRFASTKIICRVRSLKMKSTVKDGDMAAYTPVAFEFREVV